MDEGVEASVRIQDMTDPSGDSQDLYPTSKKLNHRL